MRRKGWFFWLSLIVIFTVLLNLPFALSRSLKSATRQLLAPLQGLVTTYTDRVKDAGQAIQGWGSKGEENAKLSEELARARHQVQELQRMERENVLLRRQLGFARRFPKRLLACEVLTRDISGWWQTVRVAHGGDPGVLANQAVLTADGLVGKVTDVSLKTCDILLLSDPGCKVSVTIGENSSAYGVLTGQGLSWRGSVLCRMDLINKNMPVEASDPVYTSGLGGVFPQGILVGYVEEVRIDNTGLYQTALVRPSANLGDLNVLFIITDNEQDPPSGEAVP